MSAQHPIWTRKLLSAPHHVPDKAQRVRRMFNGIAPRYELVNTLFSAGLDAMWRRRAADLAEVGASDDVLDIACGTGDLARAFASAGAQRVVGCDFAHQMLIRAIHRQPPMHGCEADALRLPFPAGSFSIVACAFGVRNFNDPDAGLREMFRVLRPGGRAVILEFTRPRNRLARTAYELYSRHLMPLAATLISRDRFGAYRYLPRSVVSFRDAEQMLEHLRGVGFAQASATPLTLGVVTVYVARRSGS